jgi:DNA-binding NtrC family response regulator
MKKASSRYEVFLDMGKILIVDDDKGLLHTLSLLLTRHGCDVSTCTSGREALGKLEKEPFDVVISDMRMEQMSGLDLLRRIKANSPEVEVILLTAFGSIENAVEAMRAEAFDYVTKPFKNEELIVVVNRAMERKRLVSEVKYLREVLDYKYNFGTIIGESPAIRRVVEQSGKVAARDSALLIVGDSGSGKELVAKSVHDNSNRKGRRFIAVNCGVLHEDSIEFELFGSSRGAGVSGSSSSGLLEEAHGGTVFIDDIANLSMCAQERLELAIRRSVVKPVGSEETKRIDVRIIAATGSDLSVAVERKLFMNDLYELLSETQIRLPRLCDRGEDILLLAEHFVRKYCREFSKPSINFTPDAAKTLLRHSWPGNVRELENAIKRTVALTNSDRIRSEDLVLVTDNIEGPHVLTLKSGEDKEQSLEEKQLEFILKTLREHGWNYTKTAKQLGIGRTTLWRKMKKIKEREAERTAVPV